MRPPASDRHLPAPVHGPGRSAATSRRRRLRHRAPIRTAADAGWFRLPGAEHVDSLALLCAVDAFPPTAFNARLPVAWTPTVELTAHIRANPAPGWLRCRFSTLFTAEQLRRFLEGQPAAMFSVAQGLCERLADAEARIASAARDNADRRLARLLCDLERYGTPDWAQGREGMAVPVPFTHAELASWVGVSRETVDRALRRWRARHIVSTSVRKIVIHDVEALARIAGIKVTRRPAVRPGYGRIIAREVTIGDLRRALAPPQPRVGSAPLTGVNKP